MLVIVKIVIIATIISIATVGITLTVVYVASPLRLTDVCRDVTAPNVTNVSLTNNASITWDAAVADSSCELNYEVSIYIDQELIDSGQTADNQYTFSMDSLSMCSVVSIELKAISNGEYESDVVTYEWMSDFQPISSLQATLNTNIITISWSAIEEIADCQFNYTLNMDCEPKSSTNTDSSANIEDGSYQFSECLLSDEITLFNMSITPVVEDNTGVVGVGVACYYEYSMEGSGDLILGTDLESDNICPSIITDLSSDSTAEFILI